MNSDWYSIDGGAVVGIVASAIVAYLAVVLYVRLNGLRSLSKMASYDFAMTIAVGSILGATISSPEPSLLHGLLAVGSLFVLQHILSRIRLGPAEQLLDNEPVLLMRDGEFLPEAMHAVRVTRADVIGKLREANVLRLGDVRAVVLEVTGDVSVLHGDGPVDDVLLDGVNVPGGEPVEAPAT